MRLSGLVSLWAAAACLAASSPLAAQQPDSARAAQDTTKTREERIRDRLRVLSPLIGRDTVSSDSLAAEGDTTAAQQVRLRADTLPRREHIEGLTGVPRDSVMERLLQIPGYVATEYRGDNATYGADSARLDLLGHAEVVQQGQRLTADSTLTYWDRLSYACAYGQPVVSGAGVDSPITSDSLCYDISRNVGVARGARTEVSQGAVWYVRGDIVTANENVFSHDAVFTDCSLEEPHYHFGAGQMKVIRNNVLVARNVTLRFADVPVMWLPFFMQSLSQGRRSGVLMPRFGINDIARNNARYSRRIEDVGFYWAISDYLGAEVAMDWHSQNWTAFRGSFDYRFLRQFLNGAVTLRRYWRAEGGREFTLSTNNSWEPDERTSITASGSYASSSDFIRERSFDPREINQTISSRAGVNRRFDWGSTSLSASRDQYLASGNVNTSFPSLSMTLSSVTLFPALPGESSWYNNATWTANGQTSVTRSNIDEALAPPTSRDDRNVSASLNSTFTLGRFSWTQGFQMRDQVQAARDFEGDSLDLVESRDRTADWNTSLNFQQRLIGTSTFTPGLRLGGAFARDSLGQMVAGPARLDFNASLNTDLFGFFPGLGPIERIRHRVSPSIRYTYSPEPNVTDQQRALFQVGNLRERNSITIGVTQTFEGKFRQRSGAEASDTSATAAQDSAAAAAQDTASGPRRRQTGEKLTLLSLSTSAVTYDFVAAREGEGFQQTEITNNIQSDLLRGLQFSVTHDLFRTVQPAPPIDIPDDGGPVTASLLPALLAQEETSRDFAPFLSRVSASFSLNSDSWLARWLGLSPRRDERRPQEQVTPDTLETDPFGAGPALDRTRPEQGLIGTGRRDFGSSRPPSPVGTWNASFSYSLSRARNDTLGINDNQMLQGNLSMQPTENWAVSWRTGYSFTEGAFTDHALTFTRRLHDFDANFDFFKAQNGNFSFQFRVHLRANPDLKVDYEQRDLPALDRARR